jgi:hypothetical protein
MTTQGDAVREQLAERVAEVEGQWVDLRERLKSAAQTLRGMADAKRRDGFPDAARLAGKVEGVELALSYMEEADRNRALAPVLKEEQRRRAVEEWPVIEDTRQADAIRKWVLYGDMSGVDEPHYSLINAWEAQHGVVEVKL